MAHLEQIRFYPCVFNNDDGSVAIGYGNVTIVAPSALPDGSDLMITINDIKLVINVDGKPVLHFKSKKVVREGKEPEWFPHASSKNAETRAWLTTTLFALPEVQRVLRTEQIVLAA